MTENNNLNQFDKQFLLELQEDLTYCKDQLKDFSAENAKLTEHVSALKDLISFDKKLLYLLDTVIEEKYGRLNQKLVLVYEKFNKIISLLEKGTEEKK